MSKRKCGNCGTDPAKGHASVWTEAGGEVWFCHGDDEPVSCYEIQAWEPSAEGAPATPFELDIIEKLIASNQEQA